MMGMKTGYFANNLLVFGRLLRSLGLDVDSGRMLDLVQAMAQIRIAEKTDFYFALRGLLVHRREDIPIFDLAFDLFWKRPGSNGSTGKVHTRGALTPVPAADDRATSLAAFRPGTGASPSGRV